MYCISFANGSALTTACQFRSKVRRCTSIKALETPSLPAIPRSLLGLSRKSKQQPKQVKLYRPDTRICWWRWMQLVGDRLAAEQEAEESREAMQQVTEAAVEAVAEVAAEQQSAAAALDNLYYESWSSPARQAALWQDEAVMAAFRAALELCKPAVKGSTVLDLGSGPGVLAALAAQAGARRVYAVEANSSLSALIPRVARDAGVEQAVVAAAAGAVEQVTLPVERVDVLLSYWMGDMLLGGGMLRSLVHARDRYLRPGGLMMPAAARLWIVGIEDREGLAAEAAGWKVVAGLDMSAMMGLVVRTPKIASILRPSQLATAPTQLASLDLSKVTAAQARRGIPETPFTLPMTRGEKLAGVMVYWDAGFASEAGEEPSLWLSTSPLAPTTRFEQVIFNFPVPLRLEAGEELSGTFTAQPVASNPSKVQVTLSLVYRGKTARVVYAPFGGP